MRKDSISINDSTPGGTVKLKSQVVGNSNYELSKITYFIEGTGKNPREGIKVIMYDEIIQTYLLQEISNMGKLLIKYIQNRL